MGDKNRKKGGGCSAFLCLFVGFIIGMVGTLAGLAGGGYWAYKNLTIEKVEKMTNSDFGIPDGLAGKSLEELVKNVNSYTEMTVEELDTEFSLGLKHNLIIDAGVNDKGEPQKIDLTNAFASILSAKPTEVEGKMQNVIDYMTVSNVFNDVLKTFKFENLSFVSNSTYKDMKITDFFGKIGDLKVADVLDKGTDTTEGIFKYFADEKIFDLVGTVERDGVQVNKMDDIIQNMIIEDFIDVQPSDKIMYAIKDLMIKELSTQNIKNNISSLKIEDLLDTPYAPTDKMYSFTQLTIGEVMGDNLDESIGNMYLKDFVTDSSSGIMFALKDTQIKNLTSDYIMQNITVSQALGNSSTTGVMGAIGSWKLSQLTNENIDTLSLGSVLNITASSNSLLNAIKDFTIGSFSTDIETLTIGQMVGTSILSGSAILSSLASLKISDLSNDINVKNAIKTLKISDFIEVTETDTVLGKIKNLTIDELSQANAIENAIGDLTLAQVIGDDGTNTNGIWQKVKNTKINEMSSVSTTIKNYFVNSTIEELVNDDVLTYEDLGLTASDTAKYNSIKGYTITEILQVAVENWDILQTL